MRVPELQPDPMRSLTSPEITTVCCYHKKSSFINPFVPGDILQVVDHYENPRNVGSLDKTAKNVGTGLVGAPACGDVMKLQIQVDENGKIVDARFKTFGCGSAIASSSLATEWVKGKSVDEALKIKNTEIAKELCLPPVKLHCSSTSFEAECQFKSTDLAFYFPPVLAEDAIKAALADYSLKQKDEEKVAEARN
ncbi:hypothetical protein QTP70_003219 [Hemibagrus guttatus]|uniref:Iron-sulfur cluster assembly enzyme ISCU n=1 Tax=Hemibagrus guttatus TaxID=175788 RepID=A0AAE0UQR6_9TELE|nr:hypothetical protein QTP70_003219 [Hemibagrus guttatus]